MRTHRQWAWNPGVFALIRTRSETVVLPPAAFPRCFCQASFYFYVCFALYGKAFASACWASQLSLSPSGLPICICICTLFLYTPGFRAVAAKFPECPHKAAVAAFLAVPSYLAVHLAHWAIFSGLRLPSLASSCRLCPASAKYTKAIGPFLCWGTVPFFTSLSIVDWLLPCYLAVL